MREHPRWPSSSCVVTHFGSLEQGAPGRRPARPLPDVRGLRRRAGRDGVAPGRRRPHAPRDRRTARGLGLDRQQLPARRRLPALRRAGDQPAAPAVALVHRPRAHDPERRGAARSVREAIRDWQRRARARRLATTSGRRRAPRPAAGRPRARGGPAPPWSASFTVTTTTRGTRRSPTPAHGLRFRRWSDDAVRAALAGFWARTGSSPPAAADLRDDAMAGTDGADDQSAAMARIERAWDALGPVPQRLGPTHALTRGVNDDRRACPPAAADRRRVDRSPIRARRTVQTFPPPATPVGVGRRRPARGRRAPLSTRPRPRSAVVAQRPCRARADPRQGRRPADGAPGRRSPRS